MLFPLSPSTPRSKIFSALNNELLYFLKASINADRFRRGLFTKKVGKAFWENEKTKNKFSGLWQEISKLTTPKRQELFDKIKNGQNVKNYFDNRELLFPEVLPKELNEKLAELTHHLFSNTKELAKVRDSCDGETIQAHFNWFYQLNGHVCQVCGTELLLQYRSDIPEEDQWRAPYDHLLSKDKYPAYAIHPDNLLPICHTCNSKAKGAKQLLVRKQHGGADLRRLSFYPYDESCQNLVRVELQGDMLSLQLTVLWDASDVDIAEKMMAWDEVYQVKGRVQGEQADFIVWIDGDCQPDNYEDFNQQLTRKAIPPSVQIIRSECWKFWRFKLYAWIVQQDDEFIRQLWAMIEQRRSDEDSKLVYGI